MTQRPQSATTLATLAVLAVTVGGCVLTFDDALPAILAGGGDATGGSDTAGTDTVGTDTSTANDTGAARDTATASDTGAEAPGESCDRLVLFFAACAQEFRPRDVRRSCDRLTEACMTCLGDVEHCPDEESIPCMRECGSDPCFMELEECIVDDSWDAGGSGETDSGGRPDAGTRPDAGGRPDTTGGPDAGECITGACSGACCLYYDSYHSCFESCDWQCDDEFWGAEACKDCVDECYNIPGLSTISPTCASRLDALRSCEQAVGCDQHLDDGDLDAFVECRDEYCCEEYNAAF